MRPRLSLVGQERAGSVRWFLEPGELTSRDRGRFRGIVFFFFFFSFVLNEVIVIRQFRLYT